MKPIPSPYDKEALNMLNKAQKLLEKAESLEMVEHDGKKVPAFAADGKGDGDLENKAEECPDCGKTVSKMGCKMGNCGMKMEKSFEEGSQPGFTTTFDSKPAGVMFMAESGGQTRNAYYTTNQYPYTAEDVTNKGSTSSAFNMESLGSQMNPHDGGSVPRQVEEGNLSKAKEALDNANFMAEAITKAVCHACGGNQYTGCQGGLGPTCPHLRNVHNKR